MTEPVELPRSLPDGLVLRRATVADREPLADFNGRTHQRPYDTVAALWTRDLLRGDHPTGAHDSTLVIEDTATGEIVSTACFIRQTWSFDGIPLRAGRPELIGTAPAYRNRGLVREQFRVMHAWGVAVAQDLQFITGIPYYYRQFGYEPALSVGGIVARANELPGASDPDAPGVGAFRTRAATPNDIPTIMRFADQTAARSLVSTDRDAAMWRYELFDRSPGSDYSHVVELVETPDGSVAGLLAYSPHRIGGQVEVTRCEVAPGRSWRPVGEAMLRRLREVGDAQAESSGQFLSVSLTGALDHPMAQAFPALFARRPRDFFFYLRIPDLPRFLRRIAPVLERLLAQSVLAGFDGGVRLNLYRSGLEVRFVRGKIAEIAPWTPTSDDLGDARFPDLTVYQLIFGCRSIAELEYAFADCRVTTDEARALLTVIFPTVSSAPWPVG